MRLFLVVLLFISCTFSIEAQQIKYQGFGSITGIGYTQDESPFWIHSNKRGRIDETSHVSAYFNGLASYQYSRHARFEASLGGLFHDGFTQKIQFDQSYLMLKNYWLIAYAGRKQKDELYKGLSAGNENILWSLNARPLLGFHLSLKNPVPIFGNSGLNIEAVLEEFITDDDRYVKNTRIHHKSFHIVYDKIKNFEFKVGLQHFVQWGGTSPVFDDLPSDFGDYVNVFLGREGSDTVNGEEANALGNHLGSYEVYINTEIQDFKVEIMYNHLFEDSSGRVLRNTPDGRYGIYLEHLEEDQLFNSFMYEFYYTRDQSDDNITTDGNDNYFNNNVYRSGWTYENRMLAAPFFTLDNERFRISNNKVIVHHIGFAGKVNDLPYKFLASYRLNYGAKGQPVNLSKNSISTYLDIKVWQENFDINLQLGADINSEAAPNLGIGVQLSKKFF